MKTAGKKGKKVFVPKAQTIIKQQQSLPGTASLKQQLTGTKSKRQPRRSGTDTATILPDYTKASMAIFGLLRRKADKLSTLPNVAMMSFHNMDSTMPITEEGQVGVFLESANENQRDRLAEALPNAPLTELTPRFLSARLSLHEIESLLKNPALKRIHIQKQSQLHLDDCLALVGVRPNPGHPRQIRETGNGVFVGIIDSGFDLSHPMFRDAHGKLRVHALLDQTQGGAVYSASQLETQWANGKNPGFDSIGHGTHVASIAAGSQHRQLEGIAPGAHFLLVKTDMSNIAGAAKWIHTTAGNTPCVTNMSLGHHWGAHDGTDPQEQILTKLTGPGKLIVVSAGNERTDALHIGSTFFKGQDEYVPFELFSQPNGNVWAILSGWHHKDDQFEISITTPSGQEYPVPPRNAPADGPKDPSQDIYMSAKDHEFNNLVKIEIQISLTPMHMAARMLTNWQLHIRCKDSPQGRIDVWFNNSRNGRFRNHVLIQEDRTVAMPATASGVIAVASHVSKSAWFSDQGQRSDYKAILGTSSRFSGIGPTRDGRPKPEVSAPGEYVTAALAKQSGMSGNSDRARTDQQLLTMEGTSMAAPAIGGIFALFLEKRPQLTLLQIRTLLPQICTHPNATHSPGWDASWGYGNIDVPRALNLL